MVGKFLEYMKTTDSYTLKGVDFMVGDYISILKKGKTIRILSKDIHFKHKGTSRKVREGGDTCIPVADSC